MPFNNTLLVGAGCALGGITRHWLCIISQMLGWPLLGTLFVNTLGCFLAGLVVSWVYQNWLSYQEIIHCLLVVGFLGGLTTFSSFGLEILSLSKNFQIYSAIFHIVLNVSLSLLGVIAGYFLGNQLALN